MMADKNIAWYDWLRYKEEKASKKREKQNQISWDLPETLMPVTLKRRRVGYNIYNTYNKEWYVKDSNQPNNFIYLLIDSETKEVKYVGMTDEPTRRYNQHKVNNRIGVKKFFMSVVDIGTTETEQKWINDLIQKGHRLLNSMSADSATRLFGTRADS